MKMKTRLKLGTLMTTASIAAMNLNAFADGEPKAAPGGPQSVIQDIAKQATGDGEFSSINSSINEFSGNIILFVLSTVTAVVLVGLAITLLMMALGGQREKENAKGKILMAIVLLVLATPAAFFGIAGLIGSEAESAGTTINTKLGGSRDVDINKSINVIENGSEILEAFNGIEFEDAAAEEEQEYSVHI